MLFAGNNISLNIPNITLFYQLFTYEGMKKMISLYILLSVIACIYAQLPDRTVNFSPAITGIPNDTSISAALSASAAPATIWVASGTYKENEIIIPSGITIIGGFPENATSVNDRKYPGNASKEQQTILDGSYSHRVATVYGMLDGCIITKGYTYDATETTPIKGAGGGVLIDGGIVQNCIIHENAAAEKSPTPGTIPGSYIASIGDIYCTDGTILQPTYKLNLNGDIVASLAGGIPTGKIPQGIVFFVDPSATSGKFYIMGKVSSTSKQPWTNPTFDIPGIPNIANVSEAVADFNGQTNTNAIISYIPVWIAANSTQWWQPTVNYDAVKYAYEYNIPSGTQGEWFLPSAGELNNIWEVYPQINACARDILGWISSGQTMFPKSYYWSSTECKSDQIWILDTYSYPWGNWGLKKGTKTTNAYTIPVALKYSSNN